MPYMQSDPAQLHVSPLSSRKSKSQISEIIIDPDSSPPQVLPELHSDILYIAQKIRQARQQGACVMLAFGGHLVKNGAGLLLIRLLEQGWVTHVATQGAGGIHDWEFAFQGCSEEDVRANVADGTFGVWHETGKYINLAVQAGAVRGMGYGESLGAMIQQEGIHFPAVEELAEDIRQGLSNEDPLLAAKAELLVTMKKFCIAPGFMPVAHPFKAYSIAGNACRLHVPMTVHPGIGYDIIYNSPFANGAALGRGGHTDWRIFCHSVSRLSGGVFLSVGSAIMAPQIFEKALSFTNNILKQKGEAIHDHLIVVNDLQRSNWDWNKGEPPKESPEYYLRFLKSFYRMGGQVRYVAADNRVFLHQLYHACLSHRTYG
jgi:hypothetical protein